jgi:hypothetical protein
MTRESLSRRNALKAAVALVGGALCASQLGPLAAAVTAVKNESGPGLLDGKQFSMVERICDLVIPETDTPGALSAGVPGFIDLMLASWASAQTRDEYTRGFDEIDALAKIHHAAGFMECSRAQQVGLLRALDREAYADDDSDTFFRQLKKLILYGYYSSEAGASVELKHARIPGAYNGCVPLADIGRAWNTAGWRYEL